jgi:hypothetical protein
MFVTRSLIGGRERGNLGHTAFNHRFAIYAPFYPGVATKTPALVPDGSFRSTALLNTFWGLAQARMRRQTHTMANIDTYQLV